MIANIAHEAIPFAIGWFIASLVTCQFVGNFIARHAEREASDLERDE